MSAGIYTLTIDQGATLSLVLTWKDSSGNLVNLTGYTARATLRPTYSSSTTIISLTTENGRISLGGAAGTITLTQATNDFQGAVSLTGGATQLTDRNALTVEIGRAHV